MMHCCDRILLPQEGYANLRHPVNNRQLLAELYKSMSVSNIAPQSLGPGASPTFAGATITSFSAGVVVSSSSGVLSTSTSTPMSTAVLAATTSQITTSSASSTPTVVSIPTMGQATELVVPDPQSTTGTMMVLDNTNTMWPQGPITFPSTVYAMNAMGSAMALNAPYFNVQGGAVAFNTNASPVGPVLTPAVFAQTTVLGINDPGASNATIPTTLGLTPGLSVVADANNNLNACIPTQPSFMAASNSLVPIATSLPASSYTTIYTVPTGHYASVVSLALQIASGSATTSIYASPDGGTTRYQVGGFVTISVAITPIPTNGFVFLPGDSIIIQSVVATQTVLGLIKIWPVATSPIVPVVVRGAALPVGTTPLYTCPTGTLAVAVLPDGNTTLAGTTGAGVKMYQTSGSVALSLSMAGLYIFQGGVGTGTMVTAPAPGCLTAGQTLSAIVTTAPTGLFQVWFAMLQLPAASVVPQKAQGVTVKVSSRPILNMPKASLPLPEEEGWEEL